MKKTLKIGDIAPIINTRDLWGNAVDTSAKGQWYYISFHRFAACPFCNLRTNELIQQYESFKKRNIEIISIWPSDKEKMLEFAGNEKTPFPMVSDKQKKFFQEFGVTKSSMMGAIKLLFHPQTMIHALREKHKKMNIDADPKLMPASFLIDSKGEIQMAYYGKHYADHVKVETIFENVDLYKSQ